MSISQLLKLYDQALKKQVKHKKDIKRLLKLRPSGLPFCPTRFLLSYLRDEFTENSTLASSFFSSIGTSVHETIQDSLPFLDKNSFIANYKCNICQTEYPFSSTTICCNQNTSYREITFSNDYIQGSMDLLFKHKDNHYVVDIKTMSQGKSHYILENVPPGYIEQVITYSYLLYRQYKILVKAAYIFFVSRNDPYRPKVYEVKINKKVLKRVQQRLFNYRKIHNKCLNALTKKEIWNLIKNHNCRNPWCEFCSLEKNEQKRIIVNNYKKRIFPIRKAILEKIDG